MNSVNICVKTNVKKECIKHDFRSVRSASGRAFSLQAIGRNGIGMVV